MFAISSHTFHPYYYFESAATGIVPLPPSRDTTLTIETEILEIQSEQRTVTVRWFLLPCGSIHTYLEQQSGWEHTP
jgi:hypothetical protein